jgi:hypothetical protein
MARDSPKMSDVLKTHAETSPLKAILCLALITAEPMSPGILVLSVVSRK